MKICYLADVRSIHTRRWVEYFAKEHALAEHTFLTIRALLLTEIND